MAGTLDLVRNAAVGFIDWADWLNLVSTKATADIEVQCALLPIGSLESHDVVSLASTRIESLIDKIRARIVCSNVSVLPLHGAYLIVSWDDDRSSI